MPGGEPRRRLEQQVAIGAGLGIAKVQVRADEHAARPQQPAEGARDSPGVGLKPSKKARSYPGLSVGSTVAKSPSCTVIRSPTPSAAKFARASRTCSGSSSIVSIAGIRRAVGEPERGVAERAAEFEHALGRDRRGDHAENRAVVERIGSAAVLRAMAQGLRAHLGEWIGRFLRGHGSRVSLKLRDPHQPLAEILAAQQPDQRARRLLQPVDHVLAVLDAAFLQPRRHVAQEIGVAGGEIADDEAADGQPLGQRGAHQLRHAIAALRRRRSRCIARSGRRPARARTC